MEAEGTLAAAPGDGMFCDVGELRPSSYRALPITLIQGLAKGMKPDLTLRDATALGVERVLFVATDHAVVELLVERASARQERWRRIAAEAARQSGRGNLPSVEGPLSFEAGLASARESRRIALTPGAAPLFEQLAGLEAGGSIALLVGPEGGLSEREIAASREAGFVSASIGGLVLRTELAASVALGALVAWSAARVVR
jgi:16S rRNA (uracil1498-N3)-methyltransferase